jgi:hypothetical protein
MPENLIDRRLKEHSNFSWAINSATAMCFGLTSGVENSSVRALIA